MSAARIRLDRAVSSTLVVCSCGWRELALSDAAARRAACAHEAACHPDTQSARQAACHAARRRIR